MVTILQGSLVSFLKMRAHSSARPTKWGVLQGRPPKRLNALVKDGPETRNPGLACEKSLNTIQTAVYWINNASMPHQSKEYWISGVRGRVEGGWRGVG